MGYENDPLFVNAMPLIDARAADAIRRIEQGLVPSSVGHAYSALIDHARVHGLRSWFVDRNINETKQWFYLAARLEVAGLDKPMEEGKLRGISFSPKTDQFMYTLLSDFDPLIKVYANLTYPDYEKAIKNPRSGESLAHLIQLALREEWDQLSVKVSKMREKSSQRNQILLIDLDFYEGLISGGVARMEKALAELVEPKMHGYRNENYIISGNFLSHPAIILAKLAWMKGYPVKVDSPFIPMALLPVEPLPHYDDVYSFLAPGWQPPKPTLWQKIFGRKP